MNNLTYFPSKVKKNCEPHSIQPHLKGRGCGPKRETRLFPFAHYALLPGAREVAKILLGSDGERTKSTVIYMNLQASLASPKKRAWQTSSFRTATRGRETRRFFRSAIFHRVSYAKESLSRPTIVSICSFEIAFWTWVQYSAIYWRYVNKSCQMTHQMWVSSGHCEAAFLAGFEKA